MVNRATLAPQPITKQCSKASTSRWASPFGSAAVSAVSLMQDFDARKLPLPPNVTTPPLITVPTDQGRCAAHPLPHYVIRAPYVRSLPEDDARGHFVVSPGGCARAAQKQRETALSLIGASVRVCIVALLPTQRCYHIAAAFHGAVPPRSCSSCWAFAGTTVFSWRLYIASKGAPPASARSAAVHVASYTKACGVHWRTVSARGFEARA